MVCLQVSSMERVVTKYTLNCQDTFAYSAYSFDTFIEPVFDGLFTSIQYGEGLHTKLPGYIQPLFF